MMFRCIIFVITLLCATLPANAGRNGGTRVTVNQNTNYTVAPFPNTGQYLGFLGAFGGTCAGISGVDWTTSMSILAPTFPNNTIISWRWPNSSPFTPPYSCGFGVWSYLQISYGNYTGGTFMQVTARQVQSITTLSQTHAIRVSGPNTDIFDVINDFFLTAASGDDNQRTHEIEVFLHLDSSSIDYFNSVTPIGTVTISGIQWSVAVDTGATPRDVLFIRTDHGEVLSGTIDLKAMFSYLVGQGEVANTEWYNGHGLGSEQNQGSGTLTIDQFSVVYN